MESHGLAVVYTSESLALAALEVLVYADSDLLPPDLIILSVHISDTVPSRMLSPKALLPMPHAGGGHPNTVFSASPCSTATSINEEYCGVRHHNINFPNRRLRTLTSGGVGGE